MTPGMRAMEESHASSQCEVGTLTHRSAEQKSFSQTLSPHHDHLLTHTVDDTSLARLTKTNKQTVDNIYFFVVWCASKVATT